MITPSEVPPCLLSLTRAVSDDPTFVHRVLVAADEYRRARKAELQGPNNRKAIKKQHTGIINAGRKYLHAASLLGISGDSADVRAVKARIESSEALLESIDRHPTNLSKSDALPALCSRLARVFADHGLPNRGIATFVDSIMECIKPEGDDPVHWESIRKMDR